MTERVEADVTVIGGGIGGYVAAIRAAQLGASAVLVEKDKLGGTCLNRGCIPTKALMHSAEALAEAQHFADLGIDVGNPVLNFARVQERKRTIVEQLVGGVERLMVPNKITVLRGFGAVANPGTVVVGEGDSQVAVSTKKIIIATGSVPARVPIPGVNLPNVITSDEVLDLTELPKSMVIIGGGVIGVELAGIFAAFGSKITVVEMLPMILPPVDEEIARRFNQILRRQGVEVNVGAAVKEIKQATDGTLDVHFETAKGAASANGQYVLVATGRWPFAEGLGLSDLGVAMNRRAIVVNDRMETNVPGIYAIGDAVAGIMLAHVSGYEGEIAAENALGHERRAEYTAVPSGIYTTPEIGQVGLTEKEAKAQGIAYKVSKFPFTANGRALILGESTGLVKLICREGTQRVIGAHILGPRATELIAEATLAVRHGLTATDIVHTIHAHPTLSEAFHESAMGQCEGPIHYFASKL